MDDLTDDYEDALPMGQAHPDLTMVLSVDRGDYIIFPEGMRKFAEKHKAEAIGVDPNGNIFVLRGGFGGRMAWVELTIDPDEPSKKEKKTNG